VVGELARHRALVGTDDVAVLLAQQPRETVAEFRTAIVSSAIDEPSSMCSIDGWSRCHQTARSA